MTLYAPSPLRDADLRKERPDKQFVSIGKPPQHIYYEEYGNPDGEPVFLLHGGPGSGTNSDFHQLFDPSFYRIILFDQRNAKRSQPSIFETGALEANTPENMMQDINELASALGIDFTGNDPAKQHKIHLLGGSWGSLLGLYYAAHHPERLYSLTLAGVTLGESATLNKCFTLDANGEPQLKAVMGAKRWARCQGEWDRFVGFAHAHMPSVAADPLLAYYLIFNDPRLKRGIKLEAAHRWTMIESVAGDLNHTPEEIRKIIDTTMKPQQQLSRAVIENHWLVKLGEGAPGFFASKGNPKFNWFLQGETRDGKKPMEQLARVPLVRIVHGMKDDICPVHASYILEGSLIEAKQRLGIAGERLARALKITRPPRAGHSPDDPDLLKGLVESTNDIRDIRREEQTIARIGGAGLSPP